MLLLRIIISVTFRRVTFRRVARCGARPGQSAAPLASLAPPAPNLAQGSARWDVDHLAVVFWSWNRKKNRAPTKEHIGYFGHSIYEAHTQTHQSHIYKHHETSTNHEFSNLQPPKNMPLRGWCRLPNEEVPGEWARKLALSRPRSFLDQGHQVGFPMAHTGYHDPQ